MTSVGAERIHLNKMGPECLCQLTYHPHNDGFKLGSVEGWRSSPIRPKMEENWKRTEELKAGVLTERQWQIMGNQVQDSMMAEIAWHLGGPQQAGKVEQYMLAT